MKSGLTMFFCLCGVVAFATVGRANVSDAPATGADQNQTDAAAPTGQEPYSPIWERNVFNLTPKPPAVDPNTIESNQPPSNIKLIGITTIFGNTAILSMQEQPERGKQGGNKEEFLTMKEGERHGVLEVMEIHPDSRTVKIKNDQIVSTITFETNKGPASMAGAPHPPMGGFGGGFQPPRMGIPLNNGAPAPLPNRMMRSTPNGPSASAGQPNYGANYGATGYGSGYQQPGANLGASLFNQADTHQAPAQSQVSFQSPEEQIAQMLTQHQAAVNAGQPIPPLPPMPNGVNLNGENGNGENSSGTGQNTGSQLPPWLQNRTVPNFKPPLP